MQKIHLIVLGKLKEEYWRQAEAEYLKRLGPWAKIEIHEIKEEPFSEKDGPETIKEKEAQKIGMVLKKIKNAHIAALDERGKNFSSAGFAAHLKNLSAENPNLVFIIGGPLGLDEPLLKTARLRLSLSAMTFTHQMARVILLEQIYRAFMINQNRKYHY